LPELSAASLPQSSVDVETSGDHERDKQSQQSFGMLDKPDYGCQHHKNNDYGSQS
jgi:hypothetical protein